jgi:hypothetical protein
VLNLRNDQITGGGARDMYLQNPLLNESNTRPIGVKAQDFYGNAQWFESAWLIEEKIVASKRWEQFDRFGFHTEGTHAHGRAIGSQRVRDMREATG